MMTILSDYLKLHHQDGRFGSVALISAHGGYRSNSREVRIPVATTLIFTCKPGDKSILKVDQATTGYVSMPEIFNDQTPLKPPNYILNKFQGPAGSDARTETYDSIASSLKDASAQRKRDEEKFRDAAGEMERLQNKEGDWDQFDKYAFEAASKILACQPNMPAEMDVITVRRRRFSTHEVTLQEVIDTAQTKNPAYKTFICGFCRVLMS